MRFTPRKRGVILVFSLLITLFLVEGVLRARKGAPPTAEALFLPEARYLYAESQTPFFQREGDSWSVIRPRALPASFPDAKPANELRVFVIGESVARRLGDESVREAFQSAFTNKKVRAVNAGMGTYASAQWTGVLAEAVTHSPDIVVVMAGNNEGMRPDRLWYPLYRLNLVLRRSWLWRLAQDMLPRPNPDPSAVEARFELRLRESVRLAKSRSARVVLCTLPVNGHWPHGTPQDPPDQTSPARNEAVRRIAREEGAALADIEALFARRAPGGIPGWEAFGDAVHPRPALHALVARAIARAASGGSALDADLVAAPAAPAWTAGPELDAVAWSGFSEALQSALRDPSVLDERALAELELVARADPATLTRLRDDPAALEKAFGSGEWTRALSPFVARVLPSLRAHADEALRRAAVPRRTRSGKLL
jgi:hypothetical protein